MSEPTAIPVPPALEGLAAHSPGVIEVLRDARVQLERRSGLDERTMELVRLGALIALGAPEESYAAHIRRALEAGAGDADVWGAVLVVAPLVGVPRLVDAVPHVRAALAAASGGAGR